MVAIGCKMVAHRKAFAKCSSVVADLIVTSHITACNYFVPSFDQRTYLFVTCDLPATKAMITDLWETILIASRFLVQ